MTRKEQQKKEIAGFIEYYEKRVSTDVKVSYVLTDTPYEYPSILGVYSSLRRALQAMHAYGENEKARERTDFGNSLFIAAIETDSEAYDDEDDSRDGWYYYPYEGLCYENGEGKEVYLNIKEA